MLIYLLLGCITVGALAAAVMMATGSEAHKRLQVHLQALSGPSAPAAPEAKPTSFTQPEPGRGRTAWLDQWLAGLSLASKANLLLYQADMTTSLGSLVLGGIAASLGVGCAVFLRTSEFEPALLVALVVLPLPVVHVMRTRAKRFALFEQQLPDALDTLVRALRVGHSLVAGIGALGQNAQQPLRREFRKCFEEQSYGVELRVAMSNLADRVPLPDVRMFVAATLIQKECGGNLAEVLEKVAQVNRERFRLTRQIRVHTAQGRATGWILSLLPVFLGLGMYLMNPDGISILWRHPTGIKMLRAATVMTFIGAMLIRRIVQIRV